MDRFSLLLLEPGEIYFEDFKVLYHIRPEDKQPQIHNEVPGRLKVCSKSIVFVPFSQVLPMLKFPLSECDSIEEWTPKSFQSALAYKQEVMFISCKQTAEMLSQNIISPFKFRRKKETFVFSFIYRKVEDCLSQVQQLHRACSLPPVEQNGMIAAIVFSRQSRLSFDTSWIDSLQEKIIMETVGSKISPLVLNPGRILLTSKRLYFQAYNNLEAEPVVKIKLASIRRIFPRRYLLRPQGLEIEYEDTKGFATHIYLSLGKPGDRDLLVERISEQQELQITQDEESMTLKWQHGILSNYDYLLYINSIADRSFNDLTQYPVFPWVVQDYTSPVLDLDKEKTFRDLSKPMGAVNPERLESLKQRREDMPEPRYLYGSHYSTPGFVLYYLVRKVPEYMLCLQNGRFDHPDRMFNSIPQTWRNVTTNQSDFKELVPQFYQSGDFLTNNLGIDFGVRQSGKRIGDVQLPPWAVSPDDFVAKLRTALGEYFILFEATQAKRCVDLDTISDLNERWGLEVQISEFGQIPKQIFKNPHPQRYTTIPPAVILNTTPLTHPSSKNWVKFSRLLRDSDHQSHKEPISALAIFQDRVVVSASKDSAVKLYNLSTCTVERSVSARTTSISSIICPHKSNNILLGCSDSTILCYNINTATFGPPIPAHSDAVSCLAWSGGRLASGGWDGRVRVWRCSAEGMEGGDAVYELSLGSPVTCVSILYSESGKPLEEEQNGEEEEKVDKDELGEGWVAGGSREGDVLIWRLDGGRFSLSQQIPAHKRQVNCVLFNPSGNQVLTGGSDFSIQLFDLKTGTPVFRKDLGEEITALVWDGETTVVGGGRGTLQVWNLLQGTKIHAEKVHEGRISALAVLDQGRTVLSGGEDRRVIAWRTVKD
ncbi:protein FAN [Eurytemora carolleeae]|uniref:protein FAN n=1 Tax=Eurytemora carolleeae TaxID=1294199 RepID=UPI000C7867AB|nr:protein FAN [Eurytemora carolleeae]|eukprot:XP_023319661.1 protein FAN-like [Eurytemora affinis]